ncbi:MAG: hypothetical protein WCP57_08430 [Bacteroidota bacterium]
MQLHKKISTIQLVYAYVFLYFSILLFFSFSLNGTGDDGDSIVHYFYSKYAYIHPSFFLNHWAKPFFVLLSAPFAQFGFIGIKVFNIVNSTFALYFTYKTVAHLKVKNAHLVLVFFTFIPLHFLLTLSGLTEPLCSLMLSVAIYLIVKNKLFIAVLIFSFLPFVRSEGLVLCGVLFVWLCWTKQWKYIPYLLVGHVLYSLIGYLFFSKSLWWIFTEIPYAKLSSHYGHGTWYHYFKKMPEYLGYPFTILLILSLFTFIKFIYKNTKAILYNPATHLIYSLVYPLFYSFLFFHVIAWALGLFGSFGLLRVFVAVSPIVAIMLLQAFNYITDIKLFSTKIISYCILLILVLCTLFIYNFGMFRKELYTLNVHQLLINSIVTEIKKEYPDYHERKIVSSAAQTYLVLNRDSLNPILASNFYDLNIDAEKVKTLFIWDEWYAASEDGMSYELLANNPHLKLIHYYEKKDMQNNLRRVALFEKIN